MTHILEPHITLGLGAFTGPESQGTTRLSRGAFTGLGPGVEPTWLMVPPAARTLEAQLSGCSLEVPH